MLLQHSTAQYSTCVGDTVPTSALASKPRTHESTHTVGQAQLQVENCTRAVLSTSVPLLA